MDDSERFRDCKKLMVTCSSCGIENAFAGIITEKSTGLHCQNNDCGAIYYGRRYVCTSICTFCNVMYLYSTAGDCYCYLSNRISLLVRKCIKQYYDCWLICDVYSCGSRTTQQSVNGSACTGDCHGRMVQEYNEESLHTQLKYFESLFDVERFKKKVSQPDSTTVG